VRLTERGAEQEPVLVAGTREEPERSSTPAAKLGISIGALDERLAAQLGDDADGVLVQRVDPDGPARNAFIPATPRAGAFDIITHVNGQRVKTVAELNRVLSDVAPGSIVSVRVLYVRSGRLSGSNVVRLRVKGAT
jgi:S1-C subfamily serine protease